MSNRDDDLLLDDEAGPPPSLGRRTLGFLRELLVAVVVGVVLLIGVGRLRAPHLPESTPALTARDLVGRTFDLADYQGRKVVLNFWATWCGPCRVELPTLTSYARAHPDLPLYFVAVDGRIADLRAFAIEHDMPPDRVIAPDAPTLDRWQIGTLPTTMVIDEQGRISSAHAGVMIKPLLWWMTR